LRAFLRQHLGSLQARLLLLALLPALLSSFLFALYILHRSEGEAEQGLLRNGRDLAGQLAEMAAFDAFSGDVTTLKNLLHRNLDSHGAAAIGLINASGEWWLIAGNHAALPGTVPEARSEWRGQQQGHAYFYFSRPLGMSQSGRNDPYIQGLLSLSAIGKVVVVLDEHPITRARRESLTAILLFLLPLTLLAILLAALMSRRLSVPLHHISQTVERIAAGNLSSRLPDKVSICSNEIGLLARGVNEMANALQSGHELLEQRIETATAGLLDQKQAAEAAVRAKSKFLAAASHDLRQPLHALTLLVSALKEKVPQGELSQLANHIDASAAAMGGMLNGLLDLSRLDAGVIEARTECFPLNRVLDAIAAQFAPVARDKGLSLRIRRTRLAVNSDPLLLERILINLVSNAIRYTQRGRVIVGVRRAAGNRVQLRVLDTGLGIASEFHERIFEEYFQIDNPERHRAKGLGLGLAIVAREARLLGSQILVRSVPERGSCFSVELPRCEYTRERHEEEYHPPHVSGERPLIALIDDDELILSAMAALLDEWGMDVAPGNNAETLLEDLISLERMPDAILSDYRLPGPLDGIGVIAFLRHHLDEELPAAVITGDTAPETIAAINASCLTLLHKPIKPARLRAFLNHAIKKP